MKPGEHKTVQARILKYAQEVGWSFVPRAEAEVRRGENDGQECPSVRMLEQALKVIDEDVCSFFIS